MREGRKERRDREKQIPICNIRDSVFSTDKSRFYGDGISFRVVFGQSF